MFVLRKRFRFEAAHRLPHHDGKCRRLHGHTYHFTLVVRGPLVASGPETGMVLDYYKVGMIGEDIRALMDHQYLNDVLRIESPTAEVLAKWIYNFASDKLPLLWAVEVSETEDTNCEYCPAKDRLLALGEHTLSEIRERLYSKVAVRGLTECWPFTASCDDEGYGLCSSTLAGTRKAHRLALWLEGVEIDGYRVRHSCDNPPCCNPAHLLRGTHLQNEQDKDDRGRRPRGEGHSEAKLTDEQVRRLWEASKLVPHLKLFAKACAADLGVTVGAIENILFGWNWNHITGLPRRKAK